jgi:hypothetical protein
MKGYIKDILKKITVIGANGLSHHGPIVWTVKCDVILAPSRHIHVTLSRP